MGDDGRGGGGRDVCRNGAVGGKRGKWENDKYGKRIGEKKV